MCSAAFVELYFLSFRINAQPDSSTYFNRWSIVFPKEFPVENVKEEKKIEVAKRQTIKDKVILLNISMGIEHRA
jgi:hypothetical protein